MGATLGELLVKLGLDPSGLSTGAVQAESTIGKLENTLLSTAKVALGFGAAFEASRFIGDAIREAQELQRAETLLGTALTANVPAWDGNSAAIDGQVNAGKALLFTHVELVNSFAHLVSATHDVAEAGQIQNVAMDLARFKAISLADATDALVKIEGGRFRALAGLGIVLEKGATQAEAIAAVEKVAGGQAQAFAADTANAGQAAAVALNDASDAIGTGLAPAIVVLAGFAKDDLAPALKLVGDNLGIILPIAETLGAIFVGKVALGIVQSTAMLIANGVAMLANSRLVELLTLDEGAEAVAANTAADAEFRLGAARAAAATAGGVGVGVGAVAAAGGVTGASLMSTALSTLGAVASVVVVPLALVGTTAAVVGATIAESGSALNTAADGFSLTSQGVYEYGHQLAILKGYLDQGAISQAQYDAEVAKLPSQFSPAILAQVALMQGMDESARAAITAGQAATTAALGIDSAGQMVSAAQLTVAQATLEAKDAHDALALAETNAEDPTKAGTVATLALAEAQAADKIAADNLTAAQKALGDELTHLKGLVADQPIVVGQMSTAWADYKGSLAGVEQTAGQVISDLIALNGMHVQATIDLIIGGVEGTASLPDSQSWQKVVNDANTKAAAAVQQDITNAFAVAHTASERFWTDNNNAAQKAIDLEKQHAVAIEDTAYQLAKAALQAPVTAEEQTLQAKQKAEQLTHLQEALDAARENAAAVAAQPSTGDPAKDAAAQLAASRQVRDAQAALDDFYAQGKLDRDKASTAVAVANLDAGHKAAFDAANQTAADQAAAQKLAATERKRQFDDDLATLEAHLKKHPEAHAKMLADIAALYKKYGITPGMSSADILKSFMGSAGATAAGGSNAAVTVGGPPQAVTSVGTAPIAVLTDQARTGVVSTTDGLLRQLIGRFDTLIGMLGRFDLHGAIDVGMYATTQRVLSGGLGP